MNTIQYSKHDTKEQKRLKRNAYMRKLHSRKKKQGRMYKYTLEDFTEEFIRKWKRRYGG